MSAERFEKATLNDVSVEITGTTCDGAQKWIGVRLAWEPAGMNEGCRHRLIARDSLSINGMPLHIMAIEVYEQEGVGQTAVDESFEDDLTNLIAIDDTAFQTLEIEGRQYVVYATSHGA